VRGVPGECVHERGAVGDGWLPIQSSGCRSSITKASTVSKYSRTSRPARCSRRLDRRVAAIVL
jgi:hypothetical protein